VVGASVSRQAKGYKSEAVTEAQPQREAAVVLLAHLWCGAMVQQKRISRQTPEL
jgi:hypothetical protein